MSRLGMALGILAALSLSTVTLAKPANADQFDYILRFDNAAAAKADPVVQSHYDAVEDLFSQDRVIRVQVWRQSQDTVDQDGSTVHNYLAGFFLLVSMPRIVAILRDHSAVQLVINRDKAKTREPGFIVRSTVSPAILQDIRFEPVFMGADYPFGNLQ